MRAAVIGSGAWGTALALLLLENGHDGDPVESYTSRRSPGCCGRRGRTPCSRGWRCPKTLEPDHRYEPAVKGCQMRGAGHPVLRGARHCPPGWRSWLTRGLSVVLGVQGHREGDLPPAPARSLQAGARGPSALWWCSPAPHTPRRWAAMCPTGSGGGLARTWRQAAELVQDAVYEPPASASTPPPDIVGVELVRRPEERHRPLCRLLRRHGLR